MDTSNRIQLFGNLITLGGIIFAGVFAQRQIKSSGAQLSRAIQADTDNTLVASFLELAGKLREQTAFVRAELLPYWENGDKRQKFDDTGALIRVHRHVELIQAYSRGLRTMVNLIPSAETLGSRSFALSLELVYETAMIEYLSLVPDNPLEPREHWRTQIKSKELRDVVDSHRLDPRSERLHGAEWAYQFASNAVDYFERHLVQFLKNMTKDEVVARRSN